MNSAIKSAIENGGSQLAGVAVGVENVQFSIFTGKGTLKNLTAANPDGFDADHVIRVNQVAISVKTSSMMSQKKVIKSLALDEVEVNYERSSDRGNIETLFEKISANMPGCADAASSTFLQIDQLQIKNIKIHLIATAFKGRGTTLDLPEILLHNLGQEGTGLTPADLIRQLLSHLVQSVVKSVESQGRTQLSESMISSLQPSDSEEKDARDTVEGFFKGLEMLKNLPV